MLCLNTQATLIADAMLEKLNATSALGKAMNNELVLVLVNVNVVVSQKTRFAR